MQEATVVNVSFRLQNSLPLNSRTEVQFPKTVLDFGFTDTDQCRVTTTQADLTAPSRCKIYDNLLTIDGLNAEILAAGS